MRSQVAPNFKISGLHHRWWTGGSLPLPKNPTCHSPLPLPLSALRALNFSPSGWSFVPLSVTYNPHVNFWIIKPWSNKSTALFTKIVSIHTHHRRRSTIFSLNKDHVLRLRLTVEGVGMSGRNETHVTINGKQWLSALHWALLQEIRHRSIVAVIWVCRYHRQHGHSYHTVIACAWMNYNDWDFLSSFLILYNILKKSALQWVFSHAFFIYRVAQKIVSYRTLSISLLNIDQFSHFFHQ